MKKLKEFQKVLLRMSVLFVEPQNQNSSEGQIMSDPVYLGNPNLKRPNVTQEWTKIQIEEYAKCRDLYTSFVHTFVSYLLMSPVPFDMYDFQKEMVGTFYSNRHHL